MMSDDELRARIADAHRDDAPPPFAALMARRRRRRAPLVLLPLAAVALVLFWWSRPAPPPAIAEVRIELHDPLAFLLQPPDAQILDGVPRFDVHLNDAHLDAPINEGEMQ